MPSADSLEGGHGQDGEMKMIWPRGQSGAAYRCVGIADGMEMCIIIYVLKPFHPERPLMGSIPW